MSDDARMSFVHASCVVRGIASLTRNRFGGLTAAGESPGCSGALDGLTVGAPTDNVGLACPIFSGCGGLLAPRANVATDGLRISAPGCGENVAVAFGSTDTDGAGQPRRKAGTTAGAFECP